MAADGGFESGDMDARMPGEGLDGADAFAKRRQPARVLQRIGRRHQPPDAVEVEPFHRQQTGGEMRLMRRIEGAAEQPDTHAASIRGEFDYLPRKPRRRSGRVAAHGRVCPVPRTRYLKLVSCSAPTGPRACSLPVATPISAPKPNSPP